MRKVKPRRNMPHPRADMMRSKKKVSETTYTHPYSKSRGVRGRGGALDRRGVLDLMHGRSRMYDHRPSHPYHPGTEHDGFSPTRQTSLAPSAKRNVRCPASRMKGGCILRRTACEAGLHMDDSSNELNLIYIVATSRDSHGSIYYVTASWVPCHKHYVLRYFPLVRRKKGCSPRTNYLTRQPAVTDRRKKKKKRCPDCLAQAVSDTWTGGGEDTHLPLAFSSMDH